MKTVDHPNIGKVFEADPTEAGRHFGSELDNGIPITGHCDRKQLLPTGRLRSFMLTAFMAFLLVGCVIWPASKRELVGVRIKASQLEFVQLGVTTCSNVLGKLGPPAARFADLHVIAYAWEERSCHVTWALPGGAVCDELIGKSFCLFFELDAADQISRWEILERGFRDTLRSRAVSWAKAGGNLAALSLPTRFMPVPVPAGKSLLYVYRPGGFEVPHIAVVVQLDGQMLGDLRSGEYVSTIVEPGPHSAQLDAHMLLSAAGSLDVRKVGSTKTFEALESQIHYVEVKVPAGHGQICARARLVPESDAVPNLTRLKPW